MMLELGCCVLWAFRFLDKEKKELEPKGSNLINIEYIDDSTIHPALKGSSFNIACDVNNPFYGTEGAAFVFAPQKGASDDEVKALDKGLRHYAQLIREYKGDDIASIAGAGAAGRNGRRFTAFSECYPEVWH